jgi:hypothetical protein
LASPGLISTTSQNVYGLFGFTYKYYFYRDLRKVDIVTENTMTARQYYMTYGKYPAIHQSPFFVFIQYERYCSKGEATKRNNTAQLYYLNIWKHLAIHQSHILFLFLYGT